MVSSVHFYCDSLGYTPEIKYPCSSHALPIKLYTVCLIQSVEATPHPVFSLVCFASLYVLTLPLSHFLGILLCCRSVSVVLCVVSHPAYKNKDGSLVVHRLYSYQGFKNVELINIYVLIYKLQAFSKINKRKLYTFT